MVLQLNLGISIREKCNNCLHALARLQFQTQCVSERCVTDNVFTSVHIEEYESMARDTKLGAEY